MKGSSCRDVGDLSGLKTDRKPVVISSYLQSGSSSDLYIAYERASKNDGRGEVPLTE
jgi:hypothetical protein